MKNDESILNIALAAVRRHAIDLDNWTRTTISQKLLLPIVGVTSEEIPVVQFVIDNANWTQVTTRRVIGSINGVVRDMEFNDLDDATWGDIKNPKADRTIFRLGDMDGSQNDFLIEPGKPSMAIIYAIKTIEAIYKAST